MRAQLNVPGRKSLGFAHSLHELMGAHDDERAKDELPYMLILGFGSMAFGVGNVSTPRAGKDTRKKSLHSLGECLVHERESCDVTVVRSFINAGNAYVTDLGELKGPVDEGVTTTRASHFAFPLAARFPDLNSNGNFCTGPELADWLAKQPKDVHAISMMASYESAEQVGATLLALAAVADKYAALALVAEYPRAQSLYLPFHRTAAIAMCDMCVWGGQFTVEESRLGGNNSGNSSYANGYGLFDPANKGKVEAGRSNGGNSSYANGSGFFDPAKKGQMEAGRSNGGALHTAHGQQRCHTHPCAYTLTASRAISQVQVAAAILWERL